MDRNPLEQLNILSDEIQQEEWKLCFNHWAPLFDPEYVEEDSDIQNRKKYEEEWTACVLLRSLRIHLCLELMAEDLARCRSQLLKDWEEAAEAVSNLSCSLKITGQVLSDTLDLVLLLDPDNRKALLKQLDLKTRMKLLKTQSMSYQANLIAGDMADYCKKTDRTETMCAIIANQVLRNECRNREDPEVQRRLVLKALWKIADLDRPLTAKLCESQQQYFEDTVSLGACDFYWLYGFSVLSLGDSAPAAALLKRCHDLCMTVVGETCWMGARAGSIYHYSLLDTDQAEAAEAYLWDTLEKIDSGFYWGMDENAEFTAAYTRLVLLSMHTETQTLRGLLPHILRLRDYCIAAEETNLNPSLTVRRAENILAAYYRETGDLLQAADHQRRALESIPPNDLPVIPSDLFLYTNLLQIYTELRDLDQVRFCVDKLQEYEDEISESDYLENRVTTVLNHAYTLMEPDEEALTADRQYLAEVYEAIINNELEPPEKGRDTFVWSIISSLAELLDSNAANEEDLHRLRYVVDYFWSHPEIYTFNEIQNLSYYIFLTNIEAQLGSPKALDHLAQVIQGLDLLSESHILRITILRSAAIIYRHFRMPEQALAAAEKNMQTITSAWQKAVAYLNDRRICQLLATVQMDFNLCYAVLRGMLGSEELYERLLRFKDLPALVGRERNAFLRLAPVDEDLRSRISALQDQLAADEMNDSLRGTDTARETAAQLERLEAQFAAKFPRDVHFTEITFRGVCEKLPENHAIVEYYFVPADSSLSLTATENAKWELEIFITAKLGGQARFQHLRCPEGQVLMREALDFSDILQDPDDLSASGRKAVLRASLHRQLIAPVLPFLEGITSLYIAPDDMLCDIPFEILYGEDRIALQDRYQVCRLVCGRDLLFCDNQSSSGGGSFILGDPDYEAQRGQRTQSRTRGSQSSLEPVDYLPFSGLEARRVGRRCRSNVYTGDSATKYALRDALPCRIIHLATHGIYDENLEADSLYSSHLVFAGYNQWVRNRLESSHCGNGILTADEISRMDLRKTELVVLSACQSGMGDTTYGSVRGLLSAFSAAGARWVISHLWEANDFSTPILMDAFYEAFLKQGMDVPQALQYAKNYLKTVTIRQLKLEGWLDLPRDIPFPEEIREGVEEMRHWPDQEMPFQDEYYWGGFTVHKSR